MIFIGLCDHEFGLSMFGLNRTHLCAGLVLWPETTFLVAKFTHEEGVGLTQGSVQAFDTDCAKTHKINSAGVKTHDQSGLNGTMTITDFKTTFCARLCEFYGCRSSGWSVCWSGRPGNGTKGPGHQGKGRKDGSHPSHLANLRLIHSRFSRLSFCNSPKGQSGCRKEWLQVEKGQNSVLKICRGPHPQKFLSACWC